MQELMLLGDPKAMEEGKETYREDARLIRSIYCIDMLRGILRLVRDDVCRRHWISSRSAR